MEQRSEGYGKFNSSDKEIPAGHPAAVPVTPVAVPAVVDPAAAVPVTPVAVPAVVDPVV